MRQCPPAKSPTSQRTMNRSDTELALERFFEEVSPPAADCMAPLSAETDDEVVVVEKPRRPPLDLPSNAQIDSDEYRQFLKNKLDLECAAVARALLQVPRPAQLGIQVGGQGTGPASSPAQNESPCGSIGTSALPDMLNKQVRQTSESSREDSDYELERDTETTDDMGTQDEKRARRMLSNRESARRSRRRKQTLLGELEAQAEQLRNEKKELLERQNSCDRKYSDAAVEHRILNAQIEALRAKVKMSEERVKQVSGGYNLPFQALPKVPGVAMPLMDPSTNASVAMQTNPDQAFHHSMPSVGIHHQPRFRSSFPSNSPVSFPVNQHNNGVGNTDSGTSAMQDVEKQISAGGAPSQAMPGWHIQPALAYPNRRK